MHVNLKDNHIELPKKKREAEKIFYRQLLMVFLYRSMIMIRFKKGQRKKSTDLWQKAGGRDAVLRSFIYHRFNQVNVTPESGSFE